MGAKRKTAEEEWADPGADKSYEIDWSEQLRRPFKRGFVPYGSDAGEGEAQKKRRSLGLELVEDPAGEDATPLPLDSFEELGVLPPWVLDALRDDFRYEPSPLQAQALPIALAGQNLVAVAPPGRGQPGAYLVPAALHVDDQPPLTDEDPGPVVLVLASTQEAATKITEEATALLSHSARSARHPDGMRAVCVSGGGTRSEKMKELSSKGAHIVVGTPKRVHDMASKEQISLLRVTMLVLDGADKMMDLGFEGEMRELAGWVRPERQTAVFAATWPKTLHDLARNLCFAGGDPVRFNAKGNPKAAAGGGADPEAKAAAKEKAAPKVKAAAKPAPAAAKAAPAAAKAKAAPAGGGEPAEDGAAAAGGEAGLGEEPEAAAALAAGDFPEEW
uniref:Helicase ATP-binding domain-containing protein n=1 Tax=Alexandrium monilatum TaxID=311494 RepID=A0A7S4T4Y6_9DINO